MAKKIKVSLSGGSGGLGLSGFIGTVVAWFSNPTFTGWAGIGKSLLVGSGAAMGTTLIAIAAAAVTGMAGGILGFVFGGRDRGQAARIGAAIGALVGGLGGGIYGGIEGYKFAEDALTKCDDAKKTTVFNDVSVKKASLEKFTIGDIEFIAPPLATKAP